VLVVLVVLRVHEALDERAGGLVGIAASGQSLGRGRVLRVGDHAVGAESAVPRLLLRLVELLAVEPAPAALRSFGHRTSHKSFRDLGGFVELGHAHKVPLGVRLPERHLQHALARHHPHLVLKQRPGHHPVHLDLLLFVGRSCLCSGVLVR